MKLLNILWLVVIASACFSCGGMISDRGRDLDKTYHFKVGTFVVDREVDIAFSHEYGYDFQDKKVAIMVDSKTYVFYGTYEQLRRQKVKLSAPLMGDTYLICVHIIDPQKNKMYTWASDGGNSLREDKLNIINLLYTGIADESITLNVLHE